jgi:hypothetical protein
MQHFKQEKEEELIRKEVDVRVVGKTRYKGLSLETLIISGLLTPPASKVDMQKKIFIL